MRLYFNCIQITRTIFKLLVAWIGVMGALTLGQKIHGAHFARGSPVICVLGHSHDLERAGVFQVITEMLANGLAIFEIFFLKEAIYQGDGACCRSILLIDRAAFHNLGSDGVKVAGAYPQPGCAMVRCSGSRWRISFYIDALAPVIAFHRTIKRKADLLYARNSADILFEPPIERLQFFSLISSHLRINMQNVPIGGIKTEVSVLHIVQASRQQSRRT